MTWLGREYPFFYWTEVTRGKMPGEFIRNRRSFLTGVTTVFMDMWDGTGNINFIESASIIKISSSSASDIDSAGPGVTSIFIEGLDENFNEVGEFILMNGQTAVNTITSFARVFNMIAMKAGTTHTNVGTIYAYSGTATAGVPDDSTQIWAQMNPLMSVTETSKFMIPAGFSGQIIHSNSAISGTKSGEFNLLSRAFDLDAATIVAGRTNSGPGVSSSMDVINDGLIPEKTDLWMRAKSDQANTSLNFSYTVHLIKDI